MLHLAFLDELVVERSIAEVAAAGAPVGWSARLLLGERCGSWIRELSGVRSVAATAGALKAEVVGISRARRKSATFTAPSA